MKTPSFIRDIPGAARRQRGNPEADLQRLVVSTLRSILPRSFIVHHSANEVRMGGDKGHRAQSWAKSMGVHPGFSDLIVMGEGRLLFLELKSKTGVLSASQETFRDFAKAQGHGWALVRTLDDALDALDRAAFPTRIVRRLRPAKGGSDA